MKNTRTLSDFVNMAIENDVDFEVWYGKNQVGAVRTHMLINMNDLPPVHLHFGDKKYGQRVSVATLSGNANVHVKYDDLVAVMSENEVTSVWKRAEKSGDADNNQTVASILRNAGNDAVYVRGEVTEVNTDGNNVVLSVEATNYFMNPVTTEILGSESAVFTVEVSQSFVTENELVFEVGEDHGFTGKYAYPNRIDVG